MNTSRTWQRLRGSARLGVSILAADQGLFAPPSGRAIGPVRGHRTVVSPRTPYSCVERACGFDCEVQSLLPAGRSHHRPAPGGRTRRRRGSPAARCTSQATSANSAQDAEAGRPNRTGRSAVPRSRRYFCHDRSARDRGGGGLIGLSIARALTERGISECWSSNVTASPAAAPASRVGSCGATTGAVDRRYGRGEACRRSSGWVTRSASVRSATWSPSERERGGVARHTAVHQGLGIEAEMIDHERAGRLCRSSTSPTWRPLLRGARRVCRRVPARPALRGGGSLGRCEGSAEHPGRAGADVRGPHHRRGTGERRSSRGGHRRRRLGLVVGQAHGGRRHRPADRVVALRTAPGRHRRTPSWPAGTVGSGESPVRADRRLGFAGREQ